MINLLMRDERLIYDAVMNSDDERRAGEEQLREKDQCADEQERDEGDD